MNRVLVNGKSYRIAASYAPRKNPEGKCSHCGRWVGTFKRKEENQLRARGHKAWLRDETYRGIDVTAKVACPGTGKTVAP